MVKMRSFMLIGYKGSERYLMEWQEFYSNIEIFAKNHFAINSYLTRLDVYDDHDNLVCQFMR